MIFYLKGYVANCFNNAIVLDVNNIGYYIYMSHPENVSKNSEIVVYIYEHIHEDDHYLVGFIDNEEFIIFKELIKAKGIGPKSVLLALKYSTPEKISQSIKTNDIEYLRNVPGIGEKHVYQVLLDLRGKGIFTVRKVDISSPAGKALREMGYKVKEIKPVLSQILDTGQSTEEIIKVALRQLKNV